jgi:hypothetical protein
MCCKRCRWKFSNCYKYINTLRTELKGRSKGDLNLNLFLTKEVENYTGKDTEERFDSFFCKFSEEVIYGLGRMWPEDLQHSAEIYSQFLQQL